jgi:hypothetical protein
MTVSSVCVLIFKNVLFFVTVTYFYQPVFSFCNCLLNAVMINIIPLLLYLHVLYKNNI